MNGLFDFFARLVRGVLKLVLGVAALVFVLSLLLAWMASNRSGDRTATPDTTEPDRPTP